MKPILSIFLAFIITILLNVVLTVVNLPSLDISWVGLPFYVIYILGGIIATWYSTDKKIRYGLYYGLITAVFYGIHADFLLALINLIFICLLAGIGGYLGKWVNENKGQKLKSKNWKKDFHPIFAIMVGIFVTFISVVLLNLITGMYTTSNSSFGLTDFLIGVTAILIGGFVTTFFAKEKKMQHGIYEGIIIIIIIALMNSIVTPKFITIIVVISYFLSASIGGYLGIRISNHLK